MNNFSSLPVWYIDHIYNVALPYKSAKSKILILFSLSQILKQMIRNSEKNIVNLKSSYIAS